MKKLSEIDITEWAQNADGSFNLSHLTKLRCLPLEHGGVALRLVFSNQKAPTDRTTADEGILQLALSTNQARATADILREIADLVDQQSPAPKAGKTN
ncbi:MAG: hypothetical protein EOR26_04915 [Mesorhizobium sp.]|uniref:hypothetical protein n=1 Tax=unclassified Mesorhizobium TaxID=325217 RepID=UPI000FCBE85B|nr:MULTISPECIES: hypothetical protein [unclassified Mesorhizobium]RUV70658.1 hypothetical protein EOA78_19690 [Mesorhizobium sp. M5C.F.Cr.IN.023.01.1.1]RWI51042.1 MAG: hypothetical protein EOR15_06495 [Mesorhizobium sp.]RWI62030.1 MAG: hypothetical protein EOR16_03695 [Mesorhizobium sp.]RWJ13879.1 MAG: hypothetical protein EOR24_00945 [Mesorhizobium sp.]RWJ16894.1 MAG: hypothetical protein EOR25_13490 [Mesorhizobium sp.]